MAERARTRKAAARHRSLEQVNDAFHRAYAAARSAAVLGGPVFILLPDRLVVRRGRGATAYRIERRWVHGLKAAAHAPVAAYTLLEAHARGPLPGRLRRAIAGVAEQTAAAMAELERHFDREGANHGLRLLEETAALLAGAARGKRVVPAVLATFAARCRPVLLRVTESAARAELAALHAAVERAIAPLDARERRALQVVVAGHHQARARSLGMQYFQQRLRESPGTELRVTFGENVSTLREAMALVGTRRLDRALASAFFGDPQRLQRDVLGDAAAAVLREARFAPLR